MRTYDVASAILKNLGINRVQLMTNNPRKLKALQTFGFEVIERIPIQMNHNEKNEFYLKTKKEKLDHLFN